MVFWFLRFSVVIDSISEPEKFRVDFAAFQNGAVGCPVCQHLFVAFPNVLNTVTFSQMLLYLREIFLRVCWQWIFSRYRICICTLEFLCGSKCVDGNPPSEKDVTDKCPIGHLIFAFLNLWSLEHMRHDFETGSIIVGGNRRSAFRRSHSVNSFPWKHKCQMSNRQKSKFTDFLSFVEIERCFSITWVENSARSVCLDARGQA